MNPDKDEHLVFITSTTATKTVELMQDHMHQNIDLVSWVIKGFSTTGGVPDEMNYNLIFSDMDTAVHFIRDDHQPGIPLLLEGLMTKETYTPHLKVVRFERPKKIGKFRLELRNSSGTAPTFSSWGVVLRIY
jgi:hypothetical protein